MLVPPMPLSTTAGRVLPHGSRVSGARLAPSAASRWDDSPCPPGHNTPLPLERSPPASFKRLLGRRPLELRWNCHERVQKGRRLDVGEMGPALRAIQLWQEHESADHQNNPHQRIDRKATEEQPDFGKDERLPREAPF